MIRFAGLYRSPSTKLLFCALILTIAVGSIVYLIESRYLNNYSYFYDPVSYSFYNARLYVNLEENSRLELALKELVNNVRHPLRTIPLILLHPTLLAKNNGHLATALPMFFIFLYLLGWTVFERSSSLAYAIGCMILFCALRKMLDPRVGLPAYWLDLPAAFLVGAATLCLINSNESRNLKWLAAFAILASFATLSRYIAAAYTFIICAPILGYYLIKRYKEEGHFWATIFRPLIIISCITAILAGHFLVSHLKENIQFYSSYGYALNQNILASASNTLSLIVRFIGEKNVLFFLCAIFFVETIISKKNLSPQKDTLFISLWLLLAVPLLLILVLRASGSQQAVLYAVPLIFFVAVSPIPNIRDSLNKRIYGLLSVIIIIVSIFIGGRFAYNNYYHATHPSPDARQQKEFEVALAHLLSKEERKIVWNAYFDEFTWVPTMETFYRYGKLPLPAGQSYFNAHKSAWQADYPNLTLAEINERIYSANNKWVDIALVMADPEKAETNNWMTNSYSRSVSKFMAEKIPNDFNWKRVFQLQSRKYGAVSGYRNRTSHGQGYPFLLRNDPRVLP